MTTQQYIETVNTRYKSGMSGEHSYRGDLEHLIRELVKGVDITNEPSNVTDCGNPDYVITKGKIPIGYIEAKDIGKDLNGKQYKEQFTRYKKALENLIITDYIWFQFFQNGELVHEIKIGKIENNTVKPIVENYPQFENLIQNFCTYIGQTIKSSKKLAEMMASKARLLQDILERAINSDEETQENTSLRDQYKTFKQILINELTTKEFSDIYSQTLAYGMFAARLHDTTLENFSRQEAAELIPKSNPFLRKLFGYVAGPDIDERIKPTVDNLADVFRATNVEELLKNFGKSTKTNDPIIHFYETFLSEYDPKLRKSRGVWYTPEPVVNFIVRAVDDILKTEFNLPQGLADTSKTKIKVPEQGSTKLVEKEVHKVQILDPATGTGTFLAEVVKLIYNKNFQSMQGAWSSYVEEHLIPRLNGFELLMASYSMAHLKLDMLLRETGYSSTKDQRFNIYLTNSLEEHHPDTGTLFSNWLSTEANEANHIKRDTPVMCVIGNPPYAVSSSNKGEWIQNLITDYKKNLNERKINLDDDYIKFIRYGQHYIAKNGEGILAYISNNSFIDGLTHRQMRKHLLETFDKVYILDLHGNAKKKEVSPNGSPDQNVFDIMQGVSINIFVKTGKKNKNELGKAFYVSIQGKREFKYDSLKNKNINTLEWEFLKFTKPNFFFVPKNFDEIKIYEKGFKVDELHQKKCSGVQTDRDSLFTDNCKEMLIQRISILLSKDYSNDFINEYNIRDSSGYNLLQRISNSSFNAEKIKKINYRPFDIRNIYYDEKLISRAGYDSNKHLLRENIALIAKRGLDEFMSAPCFITLNISDRRGWSRPGMQGAESVFPLYLYPDKEAEGSFINTRTPNLNLEIVNQISEKLGLTFVPEKGSPPFEEEYPKGEVVVKVADSSLNNLPHLKIFRKNLRNNLTPAEAKLWTLLKNSQLGGIKFRRQHSFNNYILDFYSPSEKLAIELDGAVHNTEEAQEYDKKRDLFLNNYGIKVLRFENKLVFDETDFVLSEIRSAFGWSKTTPNPSLQGGEPCEVFAPIDILDYIYAVLHSPMYREKYKEFLKIDFPRVPYPKDKETFWKLVKLGGEIRELHLLESPKVNEPITSYPKNGNNKITRKLDKNDWEITDIENQLGKIWINDEQYFDKIPLIAWEFYIGGYQPAQKWLKDRRGRELNFEDILHYQKIIVSLFETDRLMKEIDVVGVE